MTPPVERKEPVERGLCLGCGEPANLNKSGIPTHPHITSCVVALMDASAALRSESARLHEQLQTANKALKEAGARAEQKSREHLAGLRCLAIRVEDLEEAIAMVREDRKEARAESARLRGALELIATQDVARTKLWQAGVEWMQEYARAALSGTDKKERECEGSGDGSSVAFSGTTGGSTNTVPTSASDAAPAADLLSALQRYGGHTDDCRATWPTPRPCTCGWSALSAELWPKKSQEQMRQPGEMTGGDSLSADSVRRPGVISPGEMPAPEANVSANRPDLAGASQETRMVADEPGQDRPASALSIPPVSPAQTGQEE